MLLLPAAAALLLVDHPGSARGRRTLLWALQLGLIVDVPTVWRRIGSVFPRWLDDVVLDFDRIFILAVFMSLLLVHRNMRRGDRRLRASPAGLAVERPAGAGNEFRPGSISTE